MNTKLLGVASVLLAVLFIPITTFAVSPQVTSSGTTIADLMQQIATLQVQIAELRADLTNTKQELAVVKEEIRITKTLRRGMEDEEVRQLQEFLRTMPTIYPEGLVTGYFGTLTEKAVKKWQAENDIESVGVVGPLTRAKLSKVTSDNLSGGSSSAMLSTPSGTVPATPAQPASQTGVATVPATPATPGVHGTDSTPPVISNIQATNITQTTAVITWTTDEVSSSEVYYARNSSVLTNETLKRSVAGNVTSHSVTLSDLVTYSGYYYLVVSKDEAGNTSTSSVKQFVPLISTPQSCTLTISLSASTPSGQNVSRGQNAVSLVKFNATPDCDGTLQSFAVSLLPMPSGYQNISTLRLYDDTTGAQLGSTQSVTGASVNFASLNTPLIANQALVVKVVGDISPSANVGTTVYGVFGGSYGVTGSGVVIGNNASGNIISGNTMTVASTPAAQYDISVTQGANGTIAPNTTSVVNGNSQTFTITPATGYQIAGVTVDGANQGAISTYTFTNVTSAHTISASFMTSVANLPAPTALKVGFGIGSGVGNWVKAEESLSFNFDLASLSGVSAFRLYQKKPQDAAFTVVGEFANPSSLNLCYLSITSGTWELLSKGGTSCPSTGWNVSRTSLYPISSYALGDYLYYMKAVDASGVEGPASLTSTSTYLGTFAIQTPIVVETSGSSNPTFRWQAVSSWSQPLSYWVMVAASDGTGQQVMYSGLTTAGPSISKVYDGTALTPGKEYSVWAYGRSHNSEQTEDRMVFASEVATFTVSASTTASVQTSNNQIANVLEAMEGILNQIRELLKQ